MKVNEIEIYNMYRWKVSADIISRGSKKYFFFIHILGFS
jgi:hypothetical protein